jgi:hypothetical protein
MTEEDVLGMCKTYFPGAEWDVLYGWAVGDAGRFTVELRCQRGDISASCEIRWSEAGSRKQMDQKTILAGNRFPEEPLTNEQALSAAAIKWREFATEAMAVVGPLPEPAEEDLMERDEFWAGFYLEGERRRGLGEPFDIKAQIEAGEKSVKDMLEE